MELCHNVFQIILTSSNSFVLGASASLFGLIGGIIMKEPLLNIRLFWFIKSPIILVFAGFFALGTIINNYFLTSQIISGDIAHIIGFLCGIMIVAIKYKETINIFYYWIIIFIGFWLIEFGIRHLFEISLITIPIIAYVLFLILVGITIVVYTYSTLKKIKKLTQNQ